MRKFSLFRIHVRIHSHYCVFSHFCFFYILKQLKFPSIAVYYYIYSFSEPNQDELLCITASVPNTQRTDLHGEVSSTWNCGYHISIKIENGKTRVDKNIIIIGDPYEIYQRPIGDRHARLEIFRRPRHASSKTDMPDRRPWHMYNIGDRHAWSETHERPQHTSLETNMPDWRVETHRRPWHATSETNMPDRRPIKDLNMFHRTPTWLIGKPSETLTC